MTWGLNLDLLLGTTSASGDPTLLTPALLTALGFTYTRTGEVLGRRAPGGPGNYVRHAADDPEFDFTEVDGKNYPSLIVRGAATPLVSYSADLTNAAWVKTGCGANLIRGSLINRNETGALANLLTNTESLSLTLTDIGRVTITNNVAVAPNGEMTADLMTETTDTNTHRIGAPSPYLDAIPPNTNQTLSCYLKANSGSPWGLLSITDISGANQVRAWFDLTNGAVGTVANIGNGANAAASIVDVGNGWYRCIVSGTPNNAGGNTFIGVFISSGDNSLSYAGSINRSMLYWGGMWNTGLTVGDYYTVGAVQTSTHTLVTATANNATVTRQLTRASANRNTRWKIKAPSTNSGDVKVSQDNGSTSITLTPGEFADIELGEQTSANPTIWLQLTDDGDTVEHYDVQMAELTAGTPVPNFVPQGATPAAVGAGACIKTPIIHPTAVDYEILVKTPASADVDNNYALVLHKTGAFTPGLDLLWTGTAAQLKPWGGADATAASASLAASTPALIHAQADSSQNIITVDDDTPVSSAGRLATSEIDRIALGVSWNVTRHFNASIIALRDNNGQLLGTTGAGFNISAIERYEASL